MKVTLLQTDIIKGNTPKNLEHIDEMLSSLRRGDTDLVVLPEMFHCGFTFDPNAVAESGSDIAIAWMQKKAEQLNAHICGSVSFPHDSKWYNRLVVAAPNGDLTTYDKRHLFTMGNEPIVYTAGRDRVVVTIAGVRILLQVCYDLRFPVFSRYNGDYDAIVYVANWPASRREAWNILLKARAIENQCYVIGVNRVGNDDMIRYSGDSVLISPRGKVEVPTEAYKEEMVTAEVDLEALQSFRSKFRVLDDRDLFTINEAQ
ncbi:MAG: amidohydrolase [Bacteroidia bacterium]|nr:amidohydrolase [Bacteroidia bacterium]